MRCVAARGSVAIVAAGRNASTFHVPLRSVERVDKAVALAQGHPLPEAASEFLSAGRLAVGLTLHGQLKDEVKSILGSHFDEELYSEVLLRASPHSDVDWSSPSDAQLALQTALYQQRIAEKNYGAAMEVIVRLRESVEASYGAHSRENVALIAARARCLECTGYHEDAAQLFDYAAAALIETEPRLAFRLSSQSAYNHCRNKDYEAAAKIFKQISNRNANGRGSKLIYSLAQAKLGIVKLLAGKVSEAENILATAMHELDELKGYSDHRSLFVRKLWSTCELASEESLAELNLIEKVKRIK